MLFIIFVIFFSFSPASCHTPVTVGMLSSGSLEEEVSLLFGLGFFLDLSKVTVVKEPFYPDNGFRVAASFCRLLYRGVNGIYSSHSSKTLTTLQSFSSTFHMPLISPSSPLNSSSSSSYSSPSSSSSSFSSSSSYQIFVKPFYPRALLHLIKFFHWKEIYYFYQDNEGLERLQQLLEVINEDEYKLKVYFYRVDGSKDVLRTLENLDLQLPSSRKLLLDLPSSESTQVLDQQYEKYSQIYKNYFLLVSMELNELPVLKVTDGGGLNVSYYVIETGSKYQKLVQDFKKFYFNKTKKHFSFSSSTSSTSSTSSSTSSSSSSSSSLSFPLDLALVIDAGLVIGQGIAKYLENYHHDNRINESLSCEHEPVRTWTHGSTMLKMMKQIRIGGLFTGPVALDQWGLRRDFKLELMQISLNKGLSKIGVWRQSSGLMIKQQNPSRQKGGGVIANKTRVVTSILSAPFLMRRNEENLHGNDQYEGYCADLTEKVAAITKFDYIIKPVEDGNYGNNKTGKWDGMVGELLSGAADVAIAPLTITADRESVIDFSKPFMSLGISIMIKKPSKDPPSVFSFLNPLSYEVWMCVIFAYIGVSVVLFLVSRFSPFEWQMEENQDHLTNNFTIFNSLWFSLGAFMQQGVDIEPRSMSGRIVGSVWWFFTLILISSYTANLAAFLTSERMQSPIESAEDLAKQTEIKYGTVIGGSTQEFFRKSSIPTYERMWAFMSSTDPWVFVKSTDEGVQRVRQKNGKYAFLTESTQNEYTNQRNPCDTMKVGGNLDAKGYGLATPMGSDLSDRVNVAILELIENSELANLEKKWWYVKGECLQEGTFKKQEATSSLKLSNVAGIFYILVGGLVLGVLIALVEYWHRKIEANRKKISLVPFNKIEPNPPLGFPQDSSPPEPQPEEIPSTLIVSKSPYSVPAKMLGIDGCNETNMQTQV